MWKSGSGGVRTSSEDFIWERFMMKKELGGGGVEERSTYPFCADPHHLI